MVKATGGFIVNIHTVGTIVQCPTLVLLTGSGVTASNRAMDSVSALVKDTISKSTISKSKTLAERERDEEAIQKFSGASLHGLLSLYKTHPNLQIGQLTPVPTTLVENRTARVDLHIVALHDLPFCVNEMLSAGRSTLSAAPPRHRCVWDSASRVGVAEHPIRRDCAGKD